MQDIRKARKLLCDGAATIELIISPPNSQWIDRKMPVLETVPFVLANNGGVVARLHHSIVLLTGIECPHLNR